MTTTRAALPDWPVRTLRVRVISGPDEGKIVASGEDRLSIGSAETNELALTDRMVSRYHAEIAATSLGFRVRDMGSTNGTFAAGIRITDALVPPGTKITLGGTTLEINDSSKRLVSLHESDVLGGLRGESMPMRRAMAVLAKVAPTAASVLLAGESGTGKEAAARVLHDEIGRAHV